jgi:parvulin-like peptidyl-prolyl isomerase
MSSVLSAPPLSIEHRPIDLNQVLQYLQTLGKLQVFLGDIFCHYVLEQEFQSIDLDESAIALATTHFRTSQKLDSEQDLQAWLIQNGLTHAAWRDQIVFHLKLEQFKAKIAEPKLLEKFIDNKIYFDQAVLSQICVEQHEQAVELKTQIEEGQRFEDLAQEYSVTSDRLTKGMLGIVSRGEILQIAGVDIYQIPVQCVSDPVQVGNLWCLFCCEQQLPAELNETITQSLQDQIFEDWLSRKIQAMHLQVLVDTPDSP